MQQQQELLNWYVTGPAKFIQAGGKNITLRPTNLLILFAIRKNCQSNGTNLLLLLLIRTIRLTAVIIEEYHCGGWNFSLHHRVQNGSGAH
jgi:hypothetical protein